MRRRPRKRGWIAKARMSKQDKADMKSWRSFGKQFGWQLHGFTNEYRATFFRADGEEVQITQSVRADITSVITRALATTV